MRIGKREAGRNEALICEAPSGTIFFSCPLTISCCGESEKGWTAHAFDVEKESARGV